MNDNDTPTADALRDAGLDPQKMGAAIVGGSQWACLIRELADAAEEKGITMTGLSISVYQNRGGEEWSHASVDSDQDSIASTLSDAVKRELERRGL